MACKIIKINWAVAFAWLSITCTPIILPNTSHGVEKDSSYPILSLTFKNENLIDVLQQISESTGYEITIDGFLGDVPVSVKLDNIKLDAALKLILGSLNHAVIWNKPEKKIFIFIYGSANPKTEADALPATSGDRINVEDNEPQSSEGEAIERSTESESSLSRPTTEKREISSDPDVSVSGKTTHFEQASKTTSD